MTYIEKQIEELWCETSEAIFTLLGYPSPLKVWHGLEFVIMTAKVLKCNENHGASISEILDTILVSYNVDSNSREISNVASQSGEQAIFATIGWLTMLYKPAKATGNGFNLQLEVKQASLKPLHARDVSKRPIPGFLRGLGDIMPNPDLRSGASNDRRSEQIHTSTLNYYALQHIGNIHVQWVDTLSAHLEFHAFSRTLMLFRFPSFCAINSLTPEQSHCFDQ